MKEGYGAGGGLVCWRVVIPVVLGVYFCVPPPAGRDESQSQTPGFGPCEGAIHCFTCPGLHPIGLPWGASIIPIIPLPYLGRKAVGVRLMVCGGYLRMLVPVPVVRVCGMNPRRPESLEKVISQSCNIMETATKREIIMSSKGAFQSPISYLQSPIQWHALGYRRSSMLHHILIYDNWPGFFVPLAKW